MLEERLQNFKCCDPIAGNGLFTFVFNGEPEERKKHFENHLSECEYCRIAAVIYRHKRHAAVLMSKWDNAKRILALADSHDPSILVKRLENRTFYFDPFPSSPGQGTAVVISESGDILSVEEQTLEEFQRRVAQA